MKKFLFNILLFSIPLLLFLALYTYSFEIRSLDFYYGKISSPRQHSLIIGNSRSAQGIKPSVLNKKLFPNSKKEFFNFSFTAIYSPFGPVYNNSVLNKIIPSIQDGIFIINVDPGSISSNTEDPNDERFFPENDHFLAHIRNVTSNPNFEYILFREEVFYKKLFQNVIRGKGYLHKDGWLEITVPIDSITVQKRLDIKLKDNYAENYNFSETRLEYLKTLIKTLQTYGKVYLVRLPMNKILLDRQENGFPNFEDKMYRMSNELKVPYKSYKDETQMYDYVDGVHLTKEAAHKLSENLADWIIKN